MAAVADEILNIIQTEARMVLDLKGMIPNVPESIDLPYDQVRSEFTRSVIVDDDAIAEPRHKRQHKALDEVGFPLEPKLGRECHELGYDVQLVIHLNSDIGLLRSG